ncbi:H2A1A protein, partial [Aegotheles bennettii]|nr:H2A1A protein [Aegotheles bennettii]
PAGGGEGKARKSRCSRSSRAGLIFSVSRVDRQLRRGGFALRFGATAAVYLSAVLQCVTNKTMDVAGKVSKKNKQQSISPSHLQEAMQKSPVLKKLLHANKPTRRGKAAPRSQSTASSTKKKVTKSKKR